MTVTNRDIADLRESLGFSQAQFAQLLGVHPLTVSKWERGILKPSPHQTALLMSFRTAREKKPDIGAIVLGLIVSAGIALALYTLLNAAFGEKK